MAGKVDNHGNSWWNWCRCCGDSTSNEGTDREKLRETDATSGHSGENQRSGSPQPTYSQYRTEVGSDPSPMK